MKRASLIFFTGSLLLVMFFHQGIQANPAARLLTVYAIVESHHLYADPWKDSTIDKAELHGHTYSDKAPLSSLIVVPFYWARRMIVKGPQREPDKQFAGHVADVVVAAIPFSFFGLALYRRVVRRMRPLGASFAALGALFGTSIFNYGNVYYGHALAGALFLGAYALAEPDLSPRGRRLFVAGLAGGLAVLTEYPLVIPVAILFASLFSQARPIARAFYFGLGALGPALGVLAWNVAITGHPLEFPYSHVTEQFKEMRTLLGVRLPDLGAGWELLFGQYRGMFFYGMPLMVLAPLALSARRTRGPGPNRRRLLWVLCLAQFLFVCSYFKWDGGWCVGPRHLAPMMMLLLYEGIAELPRASRTVRRWFGALAAGGTTINLMAAATDPLPDESVTRPYFERSWPHFLKSDLNGHARLVEAGIKLGRYLVPVWVVLFVVIAVLVAAADRRWVRGRAAPAS